MALPTKHNLDFENIEGGTPKGWDISDTNVNYIHSVDKKIYQTGKYSGSLEFIGDKAGFELLRYTIPAQYQGKKITLRGFIKTENVTDGGAGLWMKVTPGAAINSLQDKAITGTTDWQQYEVSLDLNPLKAEFIIVGGLLAGKGKMWIDNFELLIDGQPIEKAPLKKKNLASKDSLAFKDTEFANGSNLTLANLNQFSIESLALMGRVWGFLKYHHPAIASGNYNWDYELFRILPSYLGAKNTVTRDKILFAWIESLGGVEECGECKATNSNAFISPELSWITNHGMSIELQKKLTYIYSNRSQNSHFYIATERTGNPKFTNESAYTNMPYPDDGFRLLTLFRYWNMIEYYFPYKYLIDKDWALVLTDYIEKFINAKHELAYETTTLELIGEVQDTHANLGKTNKINKQRGNYFPPVFTRIIEGKLVVTDFYTTNEKENSKMSELVGLNIGDVITTINGVATEKLIAARLSHYPASNYATKLRNIAPVLLRSTNNTTEIEFTRDKKSTTKQLKLYKQHDLKMYRWYRRDPDGQSFKLLDNNIGYVTLKNIKKNDVVAIKKKFINTEGIIIDVRNYPAAFVPYTLGSFFVNETTPFVKISKMNLNNPGEFTFRIPLRITNSQKAYKGKLIVLVNEFTQSQAEFTSMAFRAGHNTTIIGSTTAGADGNVSYIDLPGNLKTGISGTGIYYPDGSETQKIGIVPDIEVLPTIAGIKAGKDELLEKAIAIIKDE